ncbi:TIGR03862 family flavoprotein [Luteimonas sp. BDR2-5]|uniref:TIGR03862 family flavoprotein n=1 Tax=Proluteimonas luteida TaxID=2878685 RepID=UPI001E3862A6|nr:TIGR03862 family flavoprotein [Luteimonas sp. BDR2-5]MCD9026687.1 TIGR03862 family flavoprotein [Luteimonas sp. BDR2-5]
MSDALSPARATVTGAPPAPPRLAIVGGGPAGLYAAEIARRAGVEVDLFDAKGSVGRKFLIAGKGGLNLTHSEPRPAFDARYGTRVAEVGRWLDRFDADALRAWAAGRGVDTFVGSSGRVFPLDRKAAPLLRGWVRQLREDGVRLHMHHRWQGWDESGALLFDTPGGRVAHATDATLLALGGGSWPQLGSDGAWQAILQARGVDVAPLLPANCGFDTGWSAHLAQRHAGAPLKPVVLHWTGGDGRTHSLQGECVLTATGIEGSAIYAASADLRDAIVRDGHALLHLDLAPGRDLARLQADLSKPRGRRSLGEHLRRAAGIGGAKAGLLFEVLDKAALQDPATVAAALKRLPLRLTAPRPVDEAISSAGGVRLEAMTGDLMLRALPGVFAAGEMLDWEASTGGYLLTACFASGAVAAEGALRWLGHGGAPARTAARLPLDAAR